MRESKLDGNQINLIKKEIRRRSDKLLGITHMTKDDFFGAIDKEYPSGMFYFENNTPTMHAATWDKGIGQFMHEQTGKPYYEIFLDLVYKP